jgi:hypothetical protein
MEKKSTDIYRREDIMYNLFLLGNSRTWENFTNISKTIYPSIDQDIWINMLVHLEFM